MTCSVSANFPAAAKMPAWRIPPPTIFRQRLALAIKSLEPSSNEPTGAAKPLDRHTVIESKYCAISLTSTSSATAAL
ncbi:Uncharacterised protein [Vibrio cholerae]|nr:Uncharacterised protein [Vibrio cholerae]CSB30079.1 Uncharacterised protein [Vibrio cholerae]CSB39582.1 Uncharacterised protein [Vibrio cholerae]CSC91785.1 Uncharacterised protein [Vibrio cholerae]